MNDIDVSSVRTGRVRKADNASGHGSANRRERMAE